MGAWRGCAALAAWLAGLGVCWAQSETVRTPIYSPSIPEQIGSRYRDAANRGATAALQGRAEEARALLQPVAAYCDELAGHGRILVSVANPAEYEAYVAEHGDGSPVDWIDITCPYAYKGLAFVDIEQKRSDSALRHLSRAEALAPYIASLPAERGYLLNQLGRPHEGLQAYLHALALVERFPSNANSKALVLRGLGYTHVELGQWDQAERSYRLSLDAEPGNALAQRELDYIRQQRPASEPGTEP